MPRQKTYAGLYVEGDKLDALKILHSIYADRVKLVCINPPSPSDWHRRYKSDGK